MTRLFIILILTIVLSVNVSKGQNLVFSKTNSKHSFPMQTGRKYTLLTKDGKTFKGIVTVTSVDIVNINAEGIGETVIEVKNLKSFTERRHIWYIAAWASLIKKNMTINVETAKVKFQPKLF